MAAKQGSSRSMSARRSVSSAKKEDRSLSVRFAEPDRAVRKLSKISSVSRGHVLLPNKATRPKTCGPVVPHIPNIIVNDVLENNSNRPSTSGNKVRRPPLTRSGNLNIAPLNPANRADTPTPDLVVKLENKPEPTDDNRSDARRSLHLPPMRNRARSVPNVIPPVPNVIHVSIPDDIPSVYVQEEKPSPSFLLTPEGPRSNRSSQRRGSINISTDRLLRDLAHGIQHAELQEEEPEGRWSSKQQDDWDQLKQCRYLRFPKRYENELEHEVDPFS